MSVYTSVSECLCVSAREFHPAKSICTEAAMDMADLDLMGGSVSVYSREYNKKVEGAVQLKVY